MKFWDWINNRRNEKPSSSYKSEVYASFLAKTRFSSFFWKPLRRISFWLVLASIVLLSGVFFLNLENKEGWNIDTIWDWYLSVSRDQSNLSAVYADTIWEIIETQGAVELFHDWRKVSLDHVRDSDKILLQKDSEITFMLSSDVKAKILGPAEFQLFEDDAWYYMINMLYWSLVELVSVDPLINTSTPVVTSELLIENESPKEFYVVVKTEHYEVLSPTNLEKIDLILHDDWKTNVIQNIGDKVVIKKKINNEYVITDLQHEHIASIEKDISIFEWIGLSKSDDSTWFEDVNLSSLKIIYDSSVKLDMVEANKEIAVVLPAKNDVVISWLNDVDVSAESDLGSWSLDLEFVENSDEKLILDDSFIGNDNAPNIEKRVMSPAQSQIFSSSLASSIVLDSSRQVFFNTYIWNSTTVTNNLIKIKTSLDVVSTTFWLWVFVDSSSVKNLLSDLFLIQDKLNSKYYVSPSFNSSISAIQQWLDMSNSIAFGLAEYCDIECLSSSSSLSSSHKSFLRTQ